MTRVYTIIVVDTIKYCHSRTQHSFPSYYTLLIFFQGLHFKDEIQSAIRGSTFFMERVLPFNVTSEGGALYSKYHDTAKSSFPQYLEEIRGMAEGVNLSYSEVG